MLRYYPPIHVCVFLVVSFFQDFLQNLCMHSCFLPCMLHTISISSLIVIIFSVIYLKRKLDIRHILVPLEDLILCTRAFLYKLMVLLQVKKYIIFYGTGILITMFIRSHHWDLSWASWTQSASWLPIFLRSSLILLFCLDRSLQGNFSRQIFRPKYWHFSSPHTS